MIGRGEVVRKEYTTRQDYVRQTDQVRILPIDATGQNKKPQTRPYTPKYTCLRF